MKVLFALTGMRTQSYWLCLNRISAPLNIWNDQQDSIAQEMQDSLNLC